MAQKRCLMIRQRPRRVFVMVSLAGIEDGVAEQTTPAPVSEKAPVKTTLRTATALGIAPELLENQGRC